MSDISKCKGVRGKEECPLKDKCYRYTALASEHYQSYIYHTPFREERGKIVCDLFWKDRRKTK